MIDWQDHGLLDDPEVTIKEVMQDGAQVEVKNGIRCLAGIIIVDKVQATVIISFSTLDGQGILPPWDNPPIEPTLLTLSILSRQEHLVP